MNLAKVFPYNHACLGKEPECNIVTQNSCATCWLKVHFFQHRKDGMHR